MESFVIPSLQFTIDSDKLGNNTSRNLTCNSLSGVGSSHRPGAVDGLEKEERVRETGKIKRRPHATDHHIA